MPKPVDPKDLEKACAALKRFKGNKTKAAESLGISRSTLLTRLEIAKRPTKTQESKTHQREEQLEADEKENSLSLSYYGRKISTVEELIEAAEVDTSIWEQDRLKVNTWEVGGKQDGGLWKMPLRQIWVTFKRKTNNVRSLESLLEDIKEKRPIKVKRNKIKRRKRRRVLEISIMDPHMGLQCQVPQSDHVWDLDLCENFYLYGVEELIKEATKVAEIEEICWVFGNDYNHIDSLKNTTTSGTPLPDNVDEYEAIKRGKELALKAAEVMLDYAPVKAYQIPGNHDSLTSYLMGLVLDSYFHNNSNFDIDASASPFKRYQFGATLLGFEHGNNISPIRLASLMANEWQQSWAATHYHEWHCGDQHRKGASKPSVFEEQGVSVDFLPGLVAPNQWHRKKSFNYQKRAATGFLIDYDCGITHRFNVNISKYTGDWLGESYDKWRSSKSS